MSDNHNVRQPVLGKDCAWCGEPAVAEIEVQPANYRTITKVDPNTGERLQAKEVSQFAITSWACMAHLAIKQNQPPHVKTPRLSKSKDHEQQGLFDTSAGPDSAIFGGGR